MSRKKEKLRKPVANDAFSRRDFLRGAGVAVSGGLLAGENSATAAAPGGSTPVLGPGAVPVTLRINGKAQKLNSNPGSRSSTRCATTWTSPAQRKSATAAPAAPAP